MGGEFGVAVYVAASEDVLLHLRGKEAGKTLVFVLWVAFSGVGGTSKVTASLIEALVHLFDGGTTFSCLFLFSLARGMSSSESSLGIWTVGVDD